MEVGCCIKISTFQELDVELDMMAQRLARRAEDREVPGSSPARD